MRIFSSDQQTVNGDSLNNKTGNSVVEQHSSSHGQVSTGLLSANIHQTKNIRHVGYSFIISIVSVIHVIHVGNDLSCHRVSSFATNRTTMVSIDRFNATLIVRSTCSTKIFSIPSTYFFATAAATAATTTTTIIIIIIVNISNIDDYLYDETLVASIKYNIFI
jgi:hypothetical protein